MFNQTTMQKFDRFVLALRIRFIVPFVFACALVLWLSLCQTHYESYWNGTIRKVQTTDFNMLHHTMPVTLSAQILAGRDDLIQQTLDSNYGLFGLVLTDASGDNIVYKTKKSYHHDSWSDSLNRKGLARQDEPYDLITDPPQLAPLFAHESPRSFKATLVNKPVRAKVLGRLYYYRDTPPSFNSDLASFLFSNVTELSGAKRGYLYISVTVLSFAAVTLLLIFLRRRSLELKERELDFVRRELEIRKKALDHLNNELATQKARKVWLEREADQAYKRAIGLKNSLEKLRDALTGAMMQQPGGAITIAPGSATSGTASAAGLADFHPPELALTGGKDAKDAKDAKDGKPNSHVRIRPVAAPPSTILEEIEILIPDLSDNANALRSQADILHDYCNALEERQVEMKRIVETAFVRAQKFSSGPISAPVSQPLSGTLSESGGSAGAGNFEGAIGGVPMAHGTGRVTGGHQSFADGVDIIDMRPN